jgi:hypothetical protein
MPSINKDTICYRDTVRYRDNEQEQKDDSGRKQERPTFYINGKPVRASGILFYVKKGKHIYFLLQTSPNGLCDFGGKTDIVDKDYTETACRESNEESGGIFDDKKLYRIAKKCHWLYEPTAKYLIHIVALPRKLQSADFSNVYDKCGGAKMDIKYYSADKIKADQLHPRIKPSLKNITSFLMQNGN